jgi:hypothetical protein
MNLKGEIEFVEKVFHEIYSKNFQKWNSVLSKLYLIEFLHENLGRYFTSQLKEKIFDNAVKIRKTITLWNIHTNIFIRYSPGSGGNFLQNCLYCSDNFSCIGMSFSELDCVSKIEKINDVSQFYELISFINRQELNSAEEKVNYLISQTKSQVVWTDPKLIKKMQLPEIDEYNIDADDSSIDKIIDHDLKVWPNCKTVIYFKNTKLFIELRRYNMWVWWSGAFKNLKNGNTMTQETLLKFIESPQRHKKIIMDKFNDIVQINSHCDLTSKVTFYMWDTNWYFSEEDTITHIKELYKILHLSGFDENAISKYYNVWIKTMSDLKTKALNEVT